LSINLKEVNIDLDYSKVTADYLKYKVNMILPEQINSPYQLLYGNKNPLDSQGNVINSKNVQRVFLDPSKFELEKQYEQGFLDKYIEDNYGKE